VSDQAAPPGGPGTQRNTETVVLEKPDLPYEVVLWNDDVNVSEIVVIALQRVFSYPASRSEQLMLIAHTEGRASVWSGARDRCIAYVQALHSYGLNATVDGGGS
jgi:ATP-dependent Clp protease adaptor protein ClpS